MSRFLGILSVLAVMLLAMGFAAANAGNRATLDLILFTLYRVPVTLVFFSGLMAGMVVMIATHLSNDLQVRRILRERLADESEMEQRWIDKNQQDLFDVERDRWEEGGEAVGVVEDEVGPGPEAREEDKAGPGSPLTVGDEVEPSSVVMFDDEAGPGPEAREENEAGPEPAAMAEDEAETYPVSGNEEAGGTDPTLPQEEETPKE